jgi:hypothetical protein
LKRATAFPRIPLQTRRKLSSGYQRISLADGMMETTPCGTTPFAKEDDKGGAFKTVNLLGTTTNVVLTDRTNGVTSDPVHIARRMTLPTVSWESIAILPLHPAQGPTRLYANPLDVGFEP